MPGPTVALAAVRNVPILPIHKWVAGDDIVLQFTVVDVNAAVRNITGFTLQWTVRESANDPDVTLQKVGTVTDGPNGLCTVTIAAADTLSLPDRWYAHALRRTDAGSAETLAWGPARLLRAAGA